MTWPIGAHWTAYAYREAQALGLSFCWLSADGLSDDPASRQIADTDGYLATPMDYVLTLHLSTEDRLLDRGGCWVRYLSLTRERMEAYRILGRCLAVQLDDEWYSRLYAGALGGPAWPSAIGGGYQRVLQAAPLVAARARDVRRILGPHVGQGVGMAETGALVPPSSELDWWGCNLYLRSNPVVPDIPTLHRLYRAAAGMGVPIMPVIEVGCDSGRPPLSVAELGRAYLPVLEQHAARIWAVGLFSLHHPSQYAPEAHVPGHGILELGEPYTSAVRALTAAYGHAGSPTM